MFLGAISLIIVIGDVAPTKITGLGIALPPGSQILLLCILAIAILYSVIMFCIYGRSDWLLVRMRQAEAQIEAERRKHSKEKEIKELEWKIQNAPNTTVRNELANTVKLTQEYEEKDSSFSGQRLQPIESKAIWLSNLRVVFEFYVPIGFVALSFFVVLVKLWLSA